MTNRAILKDEDARGWALKAARQDASYLISPRARIEALRILTGDNTVEAAAARVILHDGGSQQGLGKLPNGRPYLPAMLDEWTRAANTLGVFDDQT